MDIKKITYILIGAVILSALAVAGVWFLFFRPTASVSTNTGSSSFFGNSPDTTNTTPAPNDNGTQTINTTTTAAQKIFEITAGPIVGATLIETSNPTTTIARYINQEDGHVYDVPLGVAGAVPRVVSDVTIPGGQRAIWLEGGNAVLLQYVDSSSNIKTVYMGFPQATTTAVLPTRISFLPDGIVDVAASPDGNSVAYLLRTATGSSGYIAKSDGTNAKKIFSLPLSQLLISWPSIGTLLLQTNSSAGITGMAFEADVKSGAVSPLFSADGIMVSANRTFSNIIYQTDSTDATQPLSYNHVVKSGLDYKLAFNPIPEKCVWSRIELTGLYCATPIQNIPLNYVDLWHQGAISFADAIYSFDLNANVGKIVVIPGSGDGGGQADILEMALSPDEHYLSYTTKGDRSLWGVILAQ